MIKDLSKEWVEINKEFIEELEKSEFDILSWEFREFDLCSYLYYEKSEFVDNLEKCYWETENERRDYQEYKQNSFINFKLSKENKE